MEKYINTKNTTLTSSSQFSLSDSFVSLNANSWELSADANDFTELGGNTAGSSYLNLVKSALHQQTTTTLISKFTISGDSRVRIGYSLSCRIAGQKFSVALASVDDSGNIESTIPVPVALGIASAQQATTTLTISTTLPHGLVPGDRISIYGINDSRLNYSEALVATVPSITQITVVATHSVTALPSVTAGPFASGFIIKKDPLYLYDNAYAIIEEGTSATNVKIASRSSAGPALLSAATSMGAGHTTAINGNTGLFADAFSPSFMVEIRFRQGAVMTRTQAQDGSTTIVAVKREQCIPDNSGRYKIIFTLHNMEAMTAPVCKITSAAKSGSTTATIITDVAHGLTTSDYIMVYGIRDVTNFANLTTATAVASIINDTTFTVVMAASATATSYGGAVLRINGGNIAAPIGQTIQSVGRTSGILSVVGSATWAGILNGDVVTLYGLYGTAGADYTAYDGIYKVLGFTTSTLYLKSVGVNFGSINLGGAVLLNSSLRLHYLRCYQSAKNTVDIEGVGGLNPADYNESLPVYLSDKSVTGVAAHDAAISGNPIRVSGRALTSNYTAVSTGDTADLITTLAGAQIVKPYSIPEVDFYFAIPAGGLLDTATPMVVKEAPAAGLRNYFTNIQLYSEALTNATEFELRGADITASSQTISSNILTTGTHGLAIGDTVHVTASTVTGLTAGVSYFVLTVPTATSLTLSATRGGSILTISGTGVTATLHKVLWRTKIPTTGMPPTNCQFSDPLKGEVAVAHSIQSLTASGAGAIYCNVQGYVAP